MMVDPLCFTGDEKGYPGHYIVPAFVNAHAHLELSHLKGRIEREPEHFPVWADNVVSEVKHWTEEEIRKSYLDGLSQSIRHGSTTMVDNARWADSLVPERRRFLSRGTTAIEFSGFEHCRAEESFRDILEIHRKHGDGVGALSPHAPYSVSGALYSLSIQYASSNNLFLSLHLAETAEEVEFVTQGTGPFVDYLVRFRPRDMSDYTPAGASPVEFLHELGGLGKGTLAVHCNYLSDADIDILARTGTSVVHCPGSYEFFGHETFRLRDLLVAGVNVCLGTDSLASNDTLSIVHAMRVMRRRYDWLTDDQIFRMGTSNGHRALGWDEVHDRLPSDFCVFPWQDGRPPRTVTKEAILNDLLTGTSPPVAVFMDERVVYKG